VLPWFEARKKELANRPLIREQAFGESLDPDKLEPQVFEAQQHGQYPFELSRVSTPAFVAVPSPGRDNASARTETAAWRHYPPGAGWLSTATI
jgi:hypothetical protein